MIQFNPATSPIDKGLTLLEASAGTGKTYSLVRIIVRHIVEHSIPIRNILTVTFTVAAAAEIKQRLFAILNEVLDQVDLPHEAIENDLAKLWNSEGQDRIREVKRLTSVALAEFDSCNVFTIDAFFQRVQTEFAFECGTSFNREIEPDNLKLVDTAVRDYWRTHVYPMNTSEFSVFNHSVSFKNAVDFVSNKTASIKLDSAYHHNAGKTTELYQSHWDRLVTEVNKHFDSLKNLLTAPPAAFNAGKAPFSKTTPTKALNLLTTIQNTPEQILLNLNDIQNLRSSNLLSDTPYRKNQKLSLDEQPYASFSYALEEILQCNTSQLACAYLGEIHRYVLQRLKVIKQQRSVFTYDDVTENLAHVLSQQTQGTTLQRALFHRYNAVLIDEFQDTSPAQCSVFTKLFHHPNCYFHIIGDPKQSIYRFRGADVFSYITAAENADHRFSLTKNFRSSPRLIESTNFIFSQADDPFLADKKINFVPSEPGTPADQLPDHQNKPVFHFIHLDEQSNTKEVIKKHIVQSIMDLLEQRWNQVAPQADRSHLIDYSDIAILVSTSAEANNIGNLLTEKNIPHTLHTQTSLMDSQEASDLFLMLDALLAPSKISKLRTALLCHTFGSGQLLTDEQNWQHAVHIAIHANMLWNERGILPALLYMIEQLELRKHLIKLPSGLRKITNIIHLTEVLDEQSRQENFTPQTCLEWLEQAIQKNLNERSSDPIELKLSTDSSAITILTQHRSKGLQFPITFVTPSCMQNPKKPDLTYHDSTTGERTIAPQDDTQGESYKQRVQESMADRARLAYVSLTRAEQLCFFYYEEPDEKNQDKHATFLMLGSPTKENLLHFTNTSDHAIEYHHLTHSDITTLSEHTHRKHEQQASELNCREHVSLEVTVKNRSSSFTGLTKMAHEENYHIPPYELLEDEGVWKEFIPGAALGSMFHEILEEIDFTDSSEWETITRSKLTKFSPLKLSLDEKEKSNLITQILQKLELWMNHQIDTKIQLKKIPNNYRINEPDFTIKGDQFSLDSFRKAIANHAPQNMPSNYLEMLAHLSPENHQGFLTGFIDMIFVHEGRYHLLDWKTNKIPGHSVDNLALVMANNHYYFQYYLYTLALDQFLQLRLGCDYDPQQHLGNVYYVFLRGMNPDIPESGIFFDSFSDQRLIELRTTFTSLATC